MHDVTSEPSAGSKASAQASAGKAGISFPAVDGEESQAQAGLPVPAPLRARTGCAGDSARGEESPRQPAESSPQAGTDISGEAKVTEGR